MWQFFILENLHFALNFMAALVMFAIFWLYYVPWRDRRNRDEIPFLLGYLLLAVSYVIHASFIEETTFRTTLFGEHTHAVLVAATRLPGYLFVMWGILLDPLPRRPLVPTLAVLPISAWLLRQPRELALLPLTLASYPVAALVVSLLYRRRALRGLERHLLPIGNAFLVISLAELLAVSSLWRDTHLVSLYSLTAPFGPLWLLEHLVFGLGLVMLARWCWRYLLKRLQSQLFIIFTAAILLIFLLTTFTFTGLLFNNIRGEILRQLTIDSKVLQFSFDSQKSEVLAHAQVVAQQAAVAAALTANDSAALNAIAQNFLVGTNDSLLVIVSAVGQVIARGEDTERIGDSLSDDPLVQQALAGHEITLVVTKDAAVSPSVSVRAAVPIKTDTGISGAVLAGQLLDTAFLDGVKQATGLEAAIYGGDILSATTIIAPDGTSRWVGITESNEAVRTTVLDRGEAYAGAVDLLHVPYFAAYVPLKNSDNQTVGMLFSGQPQLATWRTAGRSIEFTFIMVAILLVLSLLPSYLAARHIVYQVR